MADPDRRTYFRDADTGERLFVSDLLRQETVGGAVVLVAAAVALAWANSPLAGSYDAFRHWVPFPEIGLDIEAWAADGALTLFFFLAGLELKREFLVGSLSRPADAAVPVVAAACGVAIPAGVYALVNRDSGYLDGWAIPAATDIAFALAVLAVVGSALPPTLRAFLLTLAVVDDLIVILIIAAFYTSELHLTPLVGALGLLAVYALMQHKRLRSRLVYIPLSVATWWFVHESGIHATIAGVALGLLTRVIPDPGEGRSPAERLEHRLVPLSTGAAVPFFALTSAGVAVEASADVAGHPIVVGVVLGLVVGKPLGVMLGAWAVTLFTRARLNEDLTWRDVFGVAVLAGVGFTVALLVADLSFDGEEAEAAKTAVILGSVLAALLASLVLGRRNRVHKRV